VPAALTASPSQPSAALAASATPIDREALIEEITHRVLAQMSDRSVRDTVRELVTEIAERLIREEIERIKRSVE
jgi:hypothetical protein